MTTWMVVGGTRSGKSAHAEKIALGLGAPVYLATGEAGDPEMAARIASHRARRGARWRLIEAPVEIAPVIADGATGTAILVDCLTLWLANLMAGDYPIVAATDRLVGAMARSRADIVLVTSEVGQGIVPENALARRFRDEAGALNQKVAAACDHVDLVVAGLALPLKRKERPLDA